MQRTLQLGTLITLMENIFFSLQQKMTSTFLLIGHLILLIPLFSAGKLNTLLKLLFYKRKLARDKLCMSSRKELLRGSSGFGVLKIF